jgi:transcriptional regulator with XRE-family HTH domain
MAAEKTERGIEIGGRLRAARRARGLTQMQVVAATGIEQATISKYEQGEIDEPSAPKIAVLARALGVSMEWIVTGEGEGPVPVAATGTDAA